MTTNATKLTTTHAGGMRRVSYHPNDRAAKIARLARSKPRAPYVIVQHPIEMTRAGILKALNTITPTELLPQ